MLGMPRIIVLLLLNVVSNIDSFGLIRETKLLQGNRDLDAVGSVPGIEGDIRRHGEGGADCG